MYAEAIFNRVGYNLTEDITVFNMFEFKKCIGYAENSQYKPCKDNIQTLNRVSYNLTKDITFFNMFETQKLYWICRKLSV